MQISRSNVLWFAVRIASLDFDRCSSIDIYNNIALQHNQLLRLAPIDANDDNEMWLSHSRIEFNSIDITD